LIGGVIAFSTFKGAGSQNQIPAVSIWGTLSKDDFDHYVSVVNNSLANRITVNYTAKTVDTIQQDFIVALARGSGPDAILLPADMLLPAKDKLLPIPYTTLSQSSFMSTYIDESRIYLDPSGTFGVPFIVDPLVLYWNRDMFNAAGVALPPKYWGDLDSIVKKITIKDDNGTVSQSAVAMGDFSNVVNAREILASLIMQFGNPITANSPLSGITSSLSSGSDKSTIPALDFFTKFVNPNDADYSWNHAWPDSKTAFLSGKLAIYFGLTSELGDIRAKNPNLNFDVAALPQLRQGGVAATYGRIYGFSIVRASQNTNAAYQVISILTQSQYLTGLTTSLYLPSVSRVVIAAGSADPYISLFNKQALIGKTWLDAGPDVSGQIFGDMAQSVVSGQKSDFQAVEDASQQYSALLQQASGVTGN
jgi:multiple sugar transport system substrate-binding protein